MCSTLEYASIRLKSAWPRMNTAATAIEIRPKNTSRSELKTASLAADSNACVRRIAKKAQFNSAPESNADTTDGASLWASGSHVCSGARPILAPYPTRNKRNAALSQSGFRSAACAIRLSMVKWVVGPPADRAATATKKLPKSARAMPTEQIKRYFHVASSERWWRWK